LGTPVTVGADVRDPQRLRQLLIDQVAELERELHHGPPGDVRAALSVVVAGGGDTALELIQLASGELIEQFVIE
jgi:hypothetical protein